MSPQVLRTERWVQASEDIVARRAYGERANEEVTIKSGTLGYMYDNREFVGGIVAFPHAVVGVPMNKLQQATTKHDTTTLANLMDLSLNKSHNAKGDQLRYFKIDSPYALPPNVHSGFNPDSVQHEREVIVENHLFHVVIGNDKATQTAPMRDIPYLVQLFKDDFTLTCKIEVNILAVAYRNLLNLGKSYGVGAELESLKDAIEKSTDPFMTKEIEEERFMLIHALTYTWFLHDFIFAVIEYEGAKISRYLSTPLAWSDFVAHNRPDAVKEE